MKKLYTPWRQKYVDDKERLKRESVSKSQCVFCSQFQENNDEQYFILKRFAHCVVLLNLYPYNAGHLMVLPAEHKIALNELEAETRCEIVEVVSLSVEILKSELTPDGFNIGLNLGKAAGAGIPSHLHFHIVPRWEGDTNFMPILAETKTISFDLKEMYRKLLGPFQKAKI